MNDFFGEINRLIDAGNTTLIGQHNAAFLNFNDGQSNVAAAFGRKAMFFAIPFTGTLRTNADVDQFALLATAEISLPSTANYTFAAIADDGVRLTIDNVTCIDRNTLQSEMAAYCTVRVRVCSL